MIKGQKQSIDDLYKQAGSSPKIHSASTESEVTAKIDRLAKKRDYACDVLNKPLLGLTYQMEIDELVSRIDRTDSALAKKE